MPEALDVGLGEPVIRRVGKQGLEQGQRRRLALAQFGVQAEGEEIDGLALALDAQAVRRAQGDLDGLRELSTQIHEVYKANDVARLTTEMYLSDMVPAMRPADAFAKMAHREIDRVSIDDLEGRVTAVLLTPYPPGIPLLIPGERFNRTIVRYL